MPASGQMASTPKQIRFVQSGGFAMPTVLGAYASRAPLPPRIRASCPRSLVETSTQGYLTRVLKSGRLPSQLAKAYAGQWPDGLDAQANPVRAVRRLRHAAGAWSLCFEGAAAASN